MEEKVLEVNELYKKYNKFELENINLEIKKGKVVGLIGPNGSGKSTTIKAIMNIISFDRGTIKVNGSTLSSNNYKIKNDVGYVGERLDYYGKVKARNIYKFVRRLFSEWDESIFIDLINKFEIDLNKKMNELSKGTAMKFSLAMALAHHPKLLILDEPTSGLDPVIRNEFLNLLDDMVRNEKCSVLFSSHITEDIVKIADEVAYIYNGELKLLANKKCILENYAYINLSSISIEKYKNNVIFSDGIDAIINCDGIDNNSLYSIKSNNSFKHIGLDELLLFIIKVEKSSGGDFS